MQKKVLTAAFWVSSLEIYSGLIPKVASGTEKLIQLFLSEVQIWPVFCLVSPSLSGISAIQTLQISLAVGPK